MAVKAANLHLVFRTAQVTGYGLQAVLGVNVTQQRPSFSTRPNWNCGEAKREHVHAEWLPLHLLESQLRCARE